GTDDGKDLARLDRKGDAVDGRAVAVVLREVGDFDDVHLRIVRAGPVRGHRPAGCNPRSNPVDRTSTDRLAGLRHPCRPPDLATTLLSPRPLGRRVVCHRTGKMAAIPRYERKGV